MRQTTWSWIKSNAMTIFGVFAIGSFALSICVMIVYFQGEANRQQDLVNSNFIGCLGGNEFRQDVIDIGEGMDELFTFVIDTLFFPAGQTVEGRARAEASKDLLEPGFNNYRDKVNQIEFNDCAARYPTADGAQESDR